jgi:hypothetical protein
VRQVTRGVAPGEEMAIVLTFAREPHRTTISPYWRTVDRLGSAAPDFLCVVSGFRTRFFARAPISMCRRTDCADAQAFSCAF